MKLTPLLACFVPLAVLAVLAASACVGDDPVSVPIPPADGGIPDGPPAPTKVPTAPTEVTAAANLPRAATVSFKTPLEGAPITRYTVRITPGGATKDVAATATSAVIDALSTGQSYTFTVSATNAVGTGPESAPTAPVTILDAAPVPAPSTACSGNAEAYVYVPTTAGATGYNIYASTTAGAAKPGAMKLTAPSAGRTKVGSLTNGTTYYVAVTSLLGTVESAPSGEVKVTPKAFKAINDVLFVASLAKNTVEMFDGYSTLPNGTGVASRSLTSTFIAGPRLGSIQVVKSAGELYVASSQTNRVNVFRDAAALTGDISPARSLSGATTTLSSPGGIAIDLTRNVLYVVNESDGIRRFDDACNVTGDVAPSAIIVPNVAFPALSRQISLDEKNDRLYVPNQANVLVFDGVSTKNGSVAPTKTFTMGATTSGRYGLSFDGTNDILYVSSRDEAGPPQAGAVWSFSGASNLPSGAITPTQTVKNADTGQALNIQVVQNRLLVLKDSATYVTRWDDAKNAATTANSRTLPQSGIFYTGATYVP